MEKETDKTMKQAKRTLALLLALALALSLGVFAVEPAGPLAGLPAGTYTYVDAPTANAAGGELSFDWAEKELTWRLDGKTGTLTPTGDALAFFQSLYLSDVPVYDWLASAMRSTEGYQGNLAGNVELTIDDAGRLSGIRTLSGLVQMTAAVTAGLCAPLLTLNGATRGQPNLLHSCITLVGSVNGLYLTQQGNVVLDRLAIGHDAEGVGMRADKIGGDTFLAGTVTVDGKVLWNCRYANIQPIHADEPATLLTNGQDIVMGGMNIGRAGRSLTLSTGAGGGDIIIGAEVTVDYGRGKPLEDPSRGTLLLSTTGDLLAGTGSVVIGTNDYRCVTVDTVGNIRGGDVTIAPTDNGKPTDVQGSVGDVTAEGKLTIRTGVLPQIGLLRAAEIERESAEPAEKPTVSALPTSSRVLVNGAEIAFEAYNIEGSNYFRLRDVAMALNGTEKQFSVYWQEGAANLIITLTSGRAYEPVGGELTPGDGAAKTAAESAFTVYLDGSQVALRSYLIGGSTFFRLRDLGRVLDFGVGYDAETGTVSVNPAERYQ